jgi:hypothetical protein
VGGSTVYRTSAASCAADKPCIVRRYLEARAVPELHCIARLPNDLRPQQRPSQYRRRIPACHLSAPRRMATERSPALWCFRQSAHSAARHTATAERKRSLPARRPASRITAHRLVRQRHAPGALLRKLDLARLGKWNAVDQLRDDARGPEGRRGECPAEQVRISQRARERDQRLHGGWSKRAGGLRAPWRGMLPTAKYSASNGPTPRARSMFPATPGADDRSGGQLENFGAIVVRRSGRSPRPKV